MSNFLRRLAIPVWVFSSLTLGALEAGAQKPDFSGTWTLDVGKSDDLAQKVRDGAGKTSVFTKMDIQRLVDRLSLLSRAAEEIEIEQTEKDFMVFDKEDNVRIYYLDGKKHPRQTPWGASLETVSTWNEDELVVVTESKEIGKITEVYAFEGEQLVFVIQVENKGFESTVVARHYFNRSSGS